MCCPNSTFSPSVSIVLWVYMLRPDSQLPACFKAGRPVLKWAARLAGAGACARGARQRAHTRVRAPWPQQIATMSISSQRGIRTMGSTERSYSFGERAAFAIPALPAMLAVHMLVRPSINVHACIHTRILATSAQCRICSKDLPPVLCLCPLSAHA